VENTTNEETTASPSVLSAEEIADRHTELDKLIDIIADAVRMDGGNLELVSADYEEGTVEVCLQGACSSCAIASMTLQGGVERILKERLPWVTEVTGSVDTSIDLFESEAMGRGAYVPKRDLAWD
jgi:Fe-S cluster biogenesis protein NfuA